MKQYDRAPGKIRLAFDGRLKTFLQHPHHPVLNNHALSGRLKGYRSINITGDWRAIYSEQEGAVAIFEVLGTHSQLYR